jgi:hypothetical protein
MKLQIDIKINWGKEDCTKLNWNSRRGEMETEEVEWGLQRVRLLLLLLLLVVVVVVVVVEVVVVVVG